MTHIVVAGSKSLSSPEWATLKYSYVEPNENQNRSGPQENGTQLATHIFLEDLYPNPAKQILTIRFNSSYECHVKIKLYDTAGRLVANVFDGEVTTGINEIQYEFNGLPNGVYIAELDAKGHRMTQKVVFHK